MELYIIIAWVSLVVGSFCIAVALLVVTRHLRRRLRDKKWSRREKLRGKFGVLYGIQLLLVACGIVGTVATWVYLEGESDSDILSITFILSITAVGVGLWAAVTNMLPIVDAVRDDG